MNRALWPLDASSRRDVGNIVTWPMGYKEQVLPPLILVAYFSHAKNVPATWQPPWYHKIRGLNKALQILFRTGNRPPPVPFEMTYQSLQRQLDATASTAANSLVRWRSEREFRACLWIPQMRLWRTDDGQTRFEMSGTYEVGWTAPPVKLLSDRPAPPMAKYNRGSGQVVPELIEPSFELWGVKVKIDVGFRIRERMARAGSFWFFGGGVPYMCMTLDVEVRTGGNHRVVFNGSSIPTQVYQADTKLRTYDMIHDVRNWPELWRTFRAGGMQMAPYRDDPIEVYLP